MIPIAKPFLGQEEIDAVTNILNSGMIAHGQVVEQAESKFAELCGTKYAVAVNSGTAALHTALSSINIKQGDEVITTPFTFISTVSSILMQRAKPVFTDIEQDTFNIDPNKIEEKITDNTKAIIAVDLFGHPCNYNAIKEIADKHNLKVIEDAAQSVGAKQDNINAGSFGDVATFSFYATKNITCGEGGMITTNNEEIDNKARVFRQHGRSDMISYDYIDLGYNYRTTNLNASILLEQLKKLDFITNKRIENSNFLSEQLSKINGIITPVIKENNKHVFHQFTIRITPEFKLSREQLLSKLIEKEIGSSVFYPKPLHLINQLKFLQHKENDFPIAEKASQEVISLPVNPHITKDQLNHIVKTFEEI